MTQPELLSMLDQAAHQVLIWVGFGTLTGLAAKAVLPGRDPGGAIATVLMGIVGTVIGCGTLMFFLNASRVTPISPLGFAAATGGAFVLLIFYRLFAGEFFLEAEDGESWWHRRRRRRRRNRIAMRTLR